jgi:hypothetical protein
VPVEAVGDEFALLPVRLQFFVSLTTSDAHWAIAQDLLRQKEKTLVSRIYRQGDSFSFDS